MSLFRPDKQRPRPTIAQQDIQSANADQLITLSPNHPSRYIDLSLATPDEQFAALVSIIEAADATNPAPNTHTPPYGEPITLDEYIPDAQQASEYLIQADTYSDAETNLDVVINDAATAEIPAWDWYNDEQYFGLGVPPGVPNWGQPVESGHTQITLPNPSAELGWDSWAGKPVLARVARMENNFPAYSAGVNRRHNMPAVLKRDANTWALTHQSRDLMLTEIQKRAMHNVVIDNVPTQPYTEQVSHIDPSLLTPEGEIGPEGVLP
jgi:ribosomal protein L25 (general stress protein Ctc)